MLRTVRRISATVYGLGILGALAFGASASLGQAVDSSCQYAPPAWQGTCLWTEDSLTDCRQRCGPDYPYSTCTPTGHCCVCRSR